MCAPPCDVVTIDGPVASGKSTVGRELARRLGFDYLDSGAMYRALTLAAQRTETDLTSPEALIELLSRTDIRLDTTEAVTRVFVEGEEVTDVIRRPAVTREVHHVANCGPLRPHMVERQRRLAQGGGLVAEGRDMGTVAFPDAVVKFYLEASLEERVRRRAEELVASGTAVDRDELRREIEERDRRDRDRPVSPLRVPGGAVVIDTTELTVAEVVDRLVAHCREKLSRGEA